TVTLNQHHDLRLVRPASTLTGPLVARLATDVGFIDFHSAIKRFKWPVLPHRFADAIRHKPCRLYGDPELSAHLEGADALLAAGHQVDCGQPFAEWNMGVLKNGADLNRVLLAASLALVHALANRLLGLGLWLQLVSAIAASALRANRTGRPKFAFQKFAGRV